MEEIDWKNLSDISVGLIEIDWKNLSDAPVGLIEIDWKKLSDLPVWRIEEPVAKFEPLLSFISEEHLRMCSCMKHLVRKNMRRKIEQIKHQINRAYQSDIPEEEIIILKESLERKGRAQVIEETSQECIASNIRCPIERELIRSTINIFGDKYDLNDPRVFTIIQSVINHQLSAHRMQLYSTSHGLTQTQYDRDGNVSYRLNPVEAEKRKFDDSLIKAMEILSNMIDGQKISGNFVVVNAEELFGQKPKIEEKKLMREIE